MEKEVMKKIQEKIKSNNVFIGLNSTVRAFKNGQLSFIVYANNVSEDIMKKLDSMGVEKHIYDGDSDALSIACGKSYGVTVLGIKK